MLYTQEHVYYNLQTVSNIMNECHVFEPNIDENYTCEELLAQGMSVSPKNYKNEFEEPICLIRDDYLDKILDYCQNRNLANQLNEIETITIKN